MKLAVALMGWLLSCGAPMALGDMIYTAQERSVLGEALGVPGGQVVEVRSVLDFEHVVAEVEAVSSNGAGQLSNIGRASQISTLEPRLITMSGSIFGRDNYGSAGFGHGFGTSRLSASFTIDSPEPYTMRVSAAGFGNQLSSWSFGLTGPNGTVFQQAGSQSPGYYESSGILAPGAYTLQASWETGAGGFGITSGSGTYDVRFAIPAPASIVILGFVGALAHRRRTV
jgi:hypothetical protein